MPQLNAYLSFDGNCAEGVNGMMMTLTYPTAAEAGRGFKALAEGGKVTMPLGETFWADCAMPELWRLPPIGTLAIPTRHRVARRFRSPLWGHAARDRKLVPAGSGWPRADLRAVRHPPQHHRSA